jgi:hypothetical protein
MAKQERLKITTPRGKAIYPWLNEPDRRFNAAGDYKITVRLNKEAEGVPELMEMLQTEHDAWIAECKNDLAKTAKKGKPVELEVNPPWKEVLDDQDEPTGEIDIKFGMKATVEPKDGKAFSQKPALCDAKKTPVNVRVGGGSEVRVNGVTNRYYTAKAGAGISLWLKAVQILMLVAPGGSIDAFDTEDDGFTYEPSEGQTATSAVAGEEEKDF